MMTVDLLRAIRDNPTYVKSRLLAVANLSMKSGYAQIAELNNKDFCQPSSNGKTWILTEKGRTWLKKIESLLTELAAKDNQ